MSISGICGIIITTANVGRLVAFYRDILGLSMAREEHGDLDIHYGVDFADLHFAIHPLADFSETEAGAATVKVAFQVDELATALARLKHAGHPYTGPFNEGFGDLVRLFDPDGNQIELVALDYSFQQG